MDGKLPDHLLNPNVCSQDSLAGLCPQKKKKKDIFVTLLGDTNSWVQVSEGVDFYWHFLAVTQSRVTQSDIARTSVLRGERFFIYFYGIFTGTVGFFWV